MTIDPPARTPSAEEARHDRLHLPHAPASLAAKSVRQPGQRRAGVVLPLFSIRTESGWGLGEITDIAPFAAWAHGAGFSVLQLLPVNQVSGADPSPYAALSAFALDPVYLSLDDCEDFAAAGGRDALSATARARLEQVQRAALVDWAGARALKQEAIALAFDRFLRDEWRAQSQRAAALASFAESHRAWLNDYALFIVLHEELEKSWLEWPPELRDRAPEALERARSQRAEAVLRAQWTQWQLDLQWRRAREQAGAVGVAIMGDLPFMVGMDSADVWANRHLFRSDAHVGTPPDEFCPEGQNWGLPVYDWRAHAEDEFAWVERRAQRSGDLYGIYRIDHVIGFYRTFFRSADGTESGFTPSAEADQLALGEHVARVMMRWADVVAEDLGTVPPFLRPSLAQLGVPGYRVLRWEKDDAGAYRDPSTWPELSVCTNATHDTDTTAQWYDALAPEERERLREIPALAALEPARPFDDQARDLFLDALYASPSRLVLVLLQDALGMRERINTPGSVDAGNWCYRMPLNVAELQADREVSRRLHELAVATGRARP